MITAREVAGRLGLKRFTRSWRGRCPACGYPGTFAVREGRDGRALLYCASCNDREALANAVALATGRGCQVEHVDDANAKAVRRRRAEYAFRLWNGSTAAPGTVADRYLAGRGLPGLAASPVLCVSACKSDPP